MKITVSSMDDGHDVMCPRCWRWCGVAENYGHLCDVCQKIILEDYPNHESVPLIKAALDKQRAKYAR